MGPHLILSLLVHLLVARLYLEVKQLGAEDGHGQILILELRPLLLAKYPNPSWDVQKVDGRLDLVDVLPSGPRRPGRGI